MNSTIFTPRNVHGIRIVLGCGLLLVLSWTAIPAQALDDKKLEEKKAEPKPAVRIAKPPAEPGAVEVAFTDGSNLKMLLREDKIALTTPHGKLLIAVADIQQIEFATRVSEEDAKRIRAAIVDLGNTEFAKREAASAQLLKLREKAYPAILRAAEEKDLEVVRRANQLLQQIGESVPAEQLVVRPKDVIHTADSIIAGRIEGVSLKAHTTQFGAVQVKLTDVRSLRSQAIEVTRPGATGGSPTNALRSLPSSSGWSSDW